MSFQNEWNYLFFRTQPMLFQSDTLIAPDPSNDVFQKYMEEEYKKRGLKAEFVDIFDYAHRGEGNLHCSTYIVSVGR